jgi:Protein of unknown function (DUF4232)
MKARLLIAPLLAVALLAAAMIAAPAASAAGAKPCSSSGLVIWAGPEEGGGTAGGFTYQVEFTNLSGASCTLAGYPAVSAVNLRGKRVGGSAGQGPATKLGPITLVDGETAVASLQIADALNFPKGKCKPTTAAGLRITVPGGSGAKIAPLAFETCAATRTKTMTVGVVTAN